MFISNAVDQFNPMLRAATIFPDSMIEQKYLSATQFITVIIAIAVALTGWVTLILTNRKMRAERAIPVIQEIRGIRSGGCEIVIENVGTRAALNVVVAIPGESKIVAGGLRSGERVAVRLPDTASVDLYFRDAAGNEGRLTKVIASSDDGPFIAQPKRPNLAKRLLIRTGFLSGE